MASQDIFSLIGQPVYVGMSSILGITVTSGLNSIMIKHFSGGSLEIGGLTLSQGHGYLFTTGEVISLDVRGTFYMIATGATATVFLLRGLSEGIPL